MQLQVRFLGCLRLLFFLLVLTVAGVASATEYHGQVFFHGLPVPGATVIVTQDNQHFSTTTDRQGLYEFPDLANGSWKIRIEMRGFVPLEDVVAIAPNIPQGNWGLKMLDLAQILAGAEPSKSNPTPQAQPPAGDPTRSKPSSETPTLVPQPTDTNKPDEGQSQDALLINGSVNNASTSRFSLSPAFGNRRPGGSKGLYNGGIGAIFNNSALDARPYSLTGLPFPKASYNQLTEVFTLGGPLKIPYLLHHGPNFFVGYERTRDRNATTQSGLVPNAAERSGDLSGLLNSSGQPLTIINPATGLPFAGPVPVSPQAQALLNLYPLPNLAGNSRYNYQTQVLDNTHLDILQLRLDKTIGRRNQITGSFGFQSSRADTANLFNFRDTTDILGVDTKINWSHLYHHQYLIDIRYRFTRLRTSVRPQFADQANISGDAGINGNDQSPSNWGPPSLVFGSGIANLTDGQSLFNRNRTDALSLSVSYTHRRHSVTFGGDFRKEEFNELTQQNPRGIFTFTGAATSGGPSSGTNGSDFADFLLGIPDTSSLAFGNPDKYFREPVYDAYVQDDWRIRPEFSVNVGLRWEYGAPISELFGRLVNLDVAPDFSSVAPVLASSPTGPITGTKYPDSLIKPDKRGFEPRIGIAWRPIPASTLVVRAGYGIYDDTSVYLRMAEMMAQQAPLSTSVSVANSGLCPLTLANGFHNCAANTADTFAVDPNFRVGYAQVWQLSLQRDLPAAFVVSANYVGIKGTRGMQEFLPNTYPIGAVNPCPSCPAGFVFVASNGNSTRESGQIELRRRLRSGITAKLNYTYSKSLDDDSQIGAQGHTTDEGSQNQNSEDLLAASQPAPPASIAQNWLNLSGERGLSSFDQRHLLKAQIQYTTGMGLGGGTLLSGWKGKLFKEWTIVSQISLGTGLPETPILLAAVPGTAITGTIRPDLTAAPIQVTADGRFLNPGAYTTPLSGQWGTARRNSITGPNQFDMDASLSRTFRLRNKYNLDIRLDAINILNHAVFTNWNTIVNSTTFGLPAAVNPMRNVQLTGRLRF